MEVKSLWVRSAAGKVWGPLPLEQIRVLLERKLISDVAEASGDGAHFSPVAEMPDLATALATSLPPRPLAGPAWRPNNVPAPPDAEAAEVAEFPSQSDAAVLSMDPQSPAEASSAFDGGPLPEAPSDLPAFGEGEWLEPVPTETRAIQAVPPMGRLEEHSPFQLYYLLAAAEASGMLVFGEGPFAISIWFKAGTPHAIESGDLGLGQYLIDQRVLTAAQLASAEPQIKKSGGDVASGLFAAGLLNPQSGFPLIQQHAQSLLTRALLFDEGPFAYDPTAPVPTSGFQLGQRWQLLSAAARKIDSPRLKRWMHGREGRAPRLAGSTGDLQLTAQETRLATQLDGTRAFGDLLAAAGAQAEALQRLALFLTEIDRLMWGPVTAGSATTAAPPTAPARSPGGAPASGPAVPSPASAKPAARPAASSGAKPAATAAPKPGAQKPAAAPAKPAPSAAPVAPAPPAPINLPALRHLVEELRDQDHFARLKVERTKGPMPKLKASYFQLAKIYHPDTVPPEAPPEARSLKEEILSLLNEANGVLSDDKKRADYFEELEAKEALGDVDIEAILAAEEDFQQALMLARNRRFAEALTFIERCIVGNAKEGEFYAWRGYCRFFAAQDKRSQRDVALKDQATALSLNPRCVAAWLFQGQIHKLLNEVPQAKAAFQKALDLDSNNVEAQRELRLFETRKR